MNCPIMRQIKSLIDRNPPVHVQFSYEDFDVPESEYSVLKKVSGSQSFVLRIFLFRSGRYDSFEGLRAEECGILNGCENGRCVRVREGYTCDCFDGYEFDLSKMACTGESASYTFISARGLGLDGLFNLSERVRRRGNLPSHLSPSGATLVR